MAAGTTRGARSLGDHDDGGKKKKRGLLWGLLALLLLILAIVLLVSLLGGDDEKKKSASGGTTTQQEQASGSGGTAATAGTIIANDQTLLPLPADGTVEDLVGEQAQGTDVAVQAVNAQEGFWVGNSATDRLYVEFGGDVGENEAGSEAYEPKVGDKVDLTGEVRPSPVDPAAALNIDDADAAELVKSQGFFVNATSVEPTG